MDHTTQALTIMLLIALAVFLILNRQYKKGAYYQVTKNSYFSTKWNTGKHGEYLIYKQLKPLERVGGKFLFNLYIPKKNGKTTELDVLLICPKGIFVFESKNYSGWIYGNEAQRNWTQTLLAKRGRSRRLYFYNPVKQNQSHIRHLKKLVGDRIPMHSLIVFSNRCTLKKISVKSANIHVLYRHDIRPTVAKIWNRAPADALTQTEIADIYNQLYPYTQVSDAVKEKHIANVEGKH